MNWLTSKWKEIEEIRKVRAEVRKLNVEAAVIPLDEKIQEVADRGVNEEKLRLLAQYGGQDDRRNELEAGLKWALESLAARIERGLTIEVKVLAPPATDREGTIAKLYGELEENGRKLQTSSSFELDPILKLSPPTPPSTDNRER